MMIRVDIAVGVDIDKGFMRDRVEIFAINFELTFSFFAFLLFRAMYLPLFCNKQGQKISELKKKTFIDH